MDSAVFAFRGYSLEELHVDLDPVAWLRLLVSFPSLFISSIPLTYGKAIHIKLLQVLQIPEELMVTS